MAHSGVVCNIVAGALASKIAPIWFFMFGSVTTATANALYAAMDEHATYFTYQFFAQALCVIGPDVVVVIGYVYLTGLVEMAEVAVVSASLQFFIALGFVCGPSLSTIVYTDLVKHKVGRALTQAESKDNPDLLSSLRASFWFWAPLGFTCELKESQHVEIVLKPPIRRSSAAVHTLPSEHEGKPSDQRKRCRG